MAVAVINLICALAGILMYAHCPQGYNYTFCASLMWIFIVQNALYFILSKRTYKLGFEFFFMVSFFFVNFAYPVFYFPVDPTWSFFDMSWHHGVINQTTAIAYLGYAFYMLGLSAFTNTPAPEPATPSFRVGATTYAGLAGICLAAFALFVLTGGYAALQSVYGGNGTLRDVGIFSYFNNLFTIAALLMAMFIWHIRKQQWWLYLGFIGFLILIIISTGSRQLALSIILILAVGFNRYVYRFKGWQILLLTMVGSMALFFIMQVRDLGMDWYAWQRKFAHLELRSFLDIFEDLTVNNINSFVLVYFANYHDLTWFQGMIIDIVSPIPKLGSYILSHSGQLWETLQGGDLPSLLLIGHNAPWGTGTNMVGEAYRSFGIVGTAICMFLIGLLIRKSYARSSSNIYWYAIYYLMVGHAVIYPRAPLLYDPRTVVWALLMLWLVRFVAVRLEKYTFKYLQSQNTSSYECNLHISTSERSH